MSNSMIYDQPFLLFQACLAVKQRLKFMYPGKATKIWKNLQILFEITY